MRQSLFMVMLGLFLSSCSEAPTPSVISETPSIAEALTSKAVLNIALQEVVDTYVMGGDRTDLQREAMTAKLVGASVSWRIKVFDIAKEEGSYRIISDLMSGSDPGSFGKLTILAFVTPRDDVDKDALLKLKTGNIVEIHGRVDSINLRTALILRPAVITRNGFKGIALGQMKSANWVRSASAEHSGR